MWWDKFIDWMLYMPMLPMIVMATVVGIYLGLGNHQRRRNLEKEMQAEEKKILDEYGAKNPTEFRELLSQTGSDYESGETANYRWTQTMTELEMFIKVPGRATRKDVQCTFTSMALEVFVSVIGEDGQMQVVRVNGAFCARVVPTECNWQLDGDGEERVLWVVLQKLKPTTTKTYWTGVLIGDAELQPKGPPVINVDANSDASMVEAMQSLKGYQKKMGKGSG